jgi:hypothetical protein
MKGWTVASNPDAGGCAAIGAPDATLGPEKAVHSNGSAPIARGTRARYFSRCGIAGCMTMRSLRVADRLSTRQGPAWSLDAPLAGVR